MIDRLKNLFFTKTGKDTAVVFVGTLVNVAAGAFFFILTPRILGPANYGLFSTAVATGLMATAIANFGIDTGILRFAKKESNDVNQILTLAFKSYVFLGLFIALFGILISPAVANFLNQPQLAGLLKIAFSATFLLLLVNFFIAGLQARREFAKAALVNISSNVARAILLIISAYFFTIGLYFITSLFFFITIISVIVGKIFLSFEFKPIDKSGVLEFYKFNFWVALSLIIASIPYDNYFLLKISGPVQTGLYAAPLKILTVFYQFGGNFTRVLATRFASFDSDEKVKNFSLKTTPVIALIITILVILIIISGPLTKLVFGPNFAGSIIPLRILSVGFIFFFVSTIPSSIILYYFGKSQMSFIITTLRYLSFVVLLFILVPSFKAIGAAYAFTISELFSFLLMTFYVLFKLNVKNAH